MFTSSGIGENIEGTLEKPETDGLSFFLSLKGIPKNKITIGDALKNLTWTTGCSKMNLNIQLPCIVPAFHITNSIIQDSNFLLVK